MATIDLKRIRSTPKSRNDSFEALAVQLFRCSFNPPNGSTFFSLRGDGGDGGVEAYFRKPDGRLVGVQAKYFFKLGDTEMRQLDDSLATALKNHPSLSDYWVYIPFDLTGRVAAGARGKSQAERFEEWKNKVEAAAKKAGSALSVTLCVDALNGYLAATQRTLVYRRFANRGLFSQGARDGTQMDVFTWMTYQPASVPQVLNETKRPFNC